MTPSVIWLDHAVVARLKAMRGPGESYSDAILQIATICAPDARIYRGR